MPSAEVETTFTSPVVEKKVGTIPEKGETNFEGKACEETKTADESMKTMEESEKMEKEKFSETENKDESNNLSGNGETEQPVRAKLWWRSRWRKTPRRRLRKRGLKIPNESQRR